MTRKKRVRSNGWRMRKKSERVKIKGQEREKKERIGEDETGVEL